MTHVMLPLRTERLELRLHRESDAWWMHRILSRADVCRYLPYGPLSEEGAREKNRERMARTGLDDDAGALSLAFEVEGKPAGWVSTWYTDRDYRIAEIGWTVDPEYSRRGFGTEAVTATLKLAFEQYGVHRVVARVDPRNTVSAALARRVGMSCEGHQRKDFWNKGEWNDTLIFALLEEDSGVETRTPRSD